MFYNIKEYDLIDIVKSKTKNKMYDAILKSKNGELAIVPFGDKRFENYWDLTGLNLYPKLNHGDDKRRAKYRKRHQVYLKKGYYSPGFFSYYYLW